MNFPVKICYHLRAKLQSVSTALIRNKQCGDWRFGKRGSIVALSARMEDPRSEVAVSIHEFIEAWLCRDAEISDEEVTAFDLKFELERTEGLHSDSAENGDDPRAPYRKQHVAATKVEKAVCKALGLSWADHCKNVEKLFS